MYTCPVCGFSKLIKPIYYEKFYPTDEICNCCAFQGGFDDYHEKLSELQMQRKYCENWIKEGYNWFDKKTKPKEWNKEVLREQLFNININLDDIL